MKIGIVGLGLIGGSILKALQNKYELYCVSKSPKTIEKASAFASLSSDDYSILKDCDVIFVATPISHTLETLDRLESIVSEDCIVTDTASVKTFVMEKERPYKFIGSHPMAGTENNGFDSSFKELFEGAKWVITPNIDTKEEDITTLKKIISEMKAEIIIANPFEHDEAVALISHMPMLVSQAIFKAAEKNDLALKLASSGFRDMTRLAMSNLTMAKDMMHYNPFNINHALTKVIESLNLLDINYVGLIPEIKEKREKMYSEDGKNIL